MYKRTLVTSALPYANAYAHLGNVAGAYLPADIYTRFLRSCSRNVIHVSGSDENGAAIVISADREGVQPREIVDKYHAANESAFRALGIDFDIFGRTTWEEHHATAREFFRALHDRGYLTEREREQFYDAGARQFLPDRYVEGTCPNCGYESARGDQCDNCSATYDQIELKNPISKISGKPPELRRTKHLYFDLGRFQDRLHAYVESHSHDWRHHVLQQSRSWLKAGLGERAITRDLTWGVDVPVDGYQGKKLYVWFDAPFGYITNTKVLSARRGDADGWKTWWCSPETRYVAFIGKDNISFHTLMFPAMLMGYNELGREQYVLPDNVPACEFLNLEGEKFSKSRHWGIDLRDYIAEHPPDPLRYTLAANMPENRDVDFTWREYQARTNNELANILGNFVNRTMQFAGRYFEGRAPSIVIAADKEADVKSLLAEDIRRSAESGQDTDAALETLVPKYLKYFTRNDLTMLLAMGAAPKRIAECYESFRFRDAVLETMNLARDANKYFNDAEPWKTRIGNPARCATTLNICLQTVRALAILFEPVVPFSAAAMWKMLNMERGASDAWRSAADLAVPTGHALGEATILFAQVDDETVEREVAKLGAGQVPSPETPAPASAAVELKPEITMDDVMKLDLRVATVLAAERVKKSEKLLKLRIRIGDLERQIVAGVGRKYEPEQLIGRRIVVVANLKPAKLMGEASQGMLLAANPSIEGVPPTVITLLGEAEDVPDGTIVR